MKFSKSATRDEIIEMKRQRVRDRRDNFYDFWLENAAPSFLERPLPPLPEVPAHL
jgi:hypothetical protein